MTIYSTAGTRIAIGPALAAKSTDFTQADFPLLDWNEIGETESLGTVGDTSAEITFDAIASSRTRRLKGTRNAGSMEIVCGIDPNDPGQLAAIAAEKTPLDYAFRMTLNDAPAGGHPSERYFVAKVASASEQYDSANSVMKLNITLWVNSNVVKVAAHV